MVEITFRIPSKAHQYGYVEISHQGGDELPSPEQLASDYMDYVVRFQKAELAAKPKRPDSRLVGDAFVEELKTAIDDPGTIMDNMPKVSAEELMRTELGAHVVSETPAPWDGQGEVPANLEPKPWQKGARRAPAADLFG